jgi:lysine-N-methylase
MYTYLDIVEQFTCEMCGQCCQNTWLVTIDADSYQRNRDWFAKQDRLEEFYRAFKIITEDKSPGEYAVINKSQQGCWFLEHDCRCRLHKEAGHQHLDAVCQTFPRYPMDTARGTDVTLSFACPAAFRLIERREPLRVVRSEQLPTSLPSENYVEYVFPRQKAPQDPLCYYFEIEHHLIDILQYRALTLSDRLALLVRTAGRLKEVQRSSDDQKRQLNQIFYENYALMDEPAAEKHAMDVTPDILIEHFLVNLTFKKIFYSFGLEKAARLLDQFYRQIKTAVVDVHGTNAELETIKIAIMDLELQFGHNRRAMKLI